MARVVFAIVLHEVFALFVDSIVRQMHAKVVQVAPERRDVLLGGEAGQALLVDENAQGHDRRDQHINS